MFLKFFAPATEKPRGLRFRLCSGAIISLLALVLLTTTFALKMVHYYAVDPVVSPRQLYHNTWKALRDNLYDQSKLKNWDEWEHKYDHLIKTEEDALRYSHILVQSVGEGYTALLPAETVARDKVSADGQYVGIGIELDHPDGLTTPVIARVLRGGPAEKAGIEKGDVLVAVDGVQSASRSLADIHQSLQGKAGEQVVLTLRRQGTSHTITVTRDVVQTPIVYYEKLPGGIGYLRIMAFHQWSTAKQVEEAMKALSDCGIIRAASFTKRSRLLPSSSRKAQSRPLSSGFPPWDCSPPRFTCRKTA